MLTYLDNTRRESRRDVQLTDSGSISAADSNLSKQCPEIVHTRSSLVGSITNSLQVSSHTGKKGR